MVSLQVFGGCIWGSVGLLVSVYIWCPSWETIRHAAETVVGLVIHSHEARSLFESRCFILEPAWCNLRGRKRGFEVAQQTGDN